MQSSELNPTGPILISEYIALIASAVSTRYALDKRLLTYYVVSVFDSSVVRKNLLIYLFIYSFGINIINYTIKLNYYLQEHGN